MNDPLNKWGFFSPCQWIFLNKKILFRNRRENYRDKIGFFLICRSANKSMNNFNWNFQWKYSIQSSVYKILWSSIELEDAIVCFSLSSTDLFSRLTKSNQSDFNGWTLLIGNEEKSEHFMKGFSLFLMHNWRISGKSNGSNVQLNGISSIQTFEQRNEIVTNLTLTHNWEIISLWMTL